MTEREKMRRTDAEGPFYADRDIIAQGDYYVRHVGAMTSEGLHGKGDIAAELAHRDILIDDLLAALRLAEQEISLERDAFYDGITNADGTIIDAINRGGLQQIDDVLDQVRAALHAARGEATLTKEADGE